LAHYNYGYFAEKKGRKSESIKSYKKALYLISTDFSKTLTLHKAIQLKNHLKTKINPQAENN